MADKKSKFGQLLMNALSSDQIACLLDVVASSDDMTRYLDDFKMVDPDMANTVARILKLGRSAAGGRAGRRLASDQRTIEYWNSLWRQWNTVVSEVGNEDGKYAVQDHHWEEPYFDGSFLALDLEPIAQDMLGLIDDVYDLVDAPDLFVEALEEIEDHISRYPEWMGVEYSEPFVLGKHATNCVLKWLWLGSQDKPPSTVALLEKVLEIEESQELLGLNQNACVEFFVNLPDDMCREIFTYLKNEEHQIDLSNIYSIWHQINHDYESRFDEAKYLDTCRVHLADNWRYGRPLIDDALSRNKMKEAEQLLEKTFSSYLGKQKRAQWYPETSLLIGERDYGHEDDQEETAFLLETWGSIAHRLHNSKRSAAARLQAVISRSPEDLDAVLKSLKRLINPKVKKTLEPLITQWKTEIAERSVPIYADPVELSDTWIHWLIDAKLDAEGKQAWFLGKLNRWLTGLKKDAKAFKKQWRLLACFTKDLPDSKKLQKKCPEFYDTVLSDDEDFQELLGNRRRRGLQKMKVSPCLKVAMDVWEAHLRKIVPDPGDAYKSEYTKHARWAKALYELNQEAYVRLIATWRKKHNRRRNLWRDMKAAGLPV